MRRFKLVGVAVMAVMALAFAAPAAAMFCVEAVFSESFQAMASSTVSVVVGATGIGVSIFLLLPRGKLDLSPPLSLSR